MIFPSLFVSFSYMLSVSCNLSPGSISLVDSNINILIYILILLRTTTSLILRINRSMFYSYPIVISAFLILLRSIREKYFSSKKRTLSSISVVFILILRFLIYLITARTCLIILRNQYKIQRLRTFLDSS
ncbi:hypothetical protein EROM_092050 [Encephalitozoon romaleae SJ-2008]|uniref:Uncharacterized protein n=1 Tax=Encephalitozoon romaleae (strain SJ-2008) TaxID=1178016 RepID=I7APM6_ENCRO|nr:hypothetical protein EROM_092050 [Encephalitozoon romaleae SJ-2008]AFN83819.1 hypothetical protein EROM_092050 [Encephalitozoon romaleae SJ-2008]